MINTSASTPTNSQSQEQKFKKVISIEDFIPTPMESKSSPAHHTSKLLDKKPSISSLTASPAHTPTTPKTFNPNTKTIPSKETPKPSKPSVDSKPIQQIKKELPRSKSSDVSEKPSSSLKHSLSNLDDDDSDLETDPANEYK